MYKFKRKCVIITLLALIFSSTVVFATENSGTQKNVNGSTNVIEQEKSNGEDGTATTILKIKQEQLKSLEDYKAKYGSDSYGLAAYVLHAIQVYSIPVGLVGIAVCAIYQYVIGLKRLDIRDKGFNTMIAMITILIICQVLPLIFAIVVKSND